MTIPITAEQVARARDASGIARDAHAINAALGARWYRRDDIPADVIAGWQTVGYRDLTAALTRWHAELVAAETRKACGDCGHVFDAATDSPVAKRSSVRSTLCVACDLRSAPIDDTAPDRLRERREALGWSLAEAANAIGAPAPDVVDVPQPIVKRSRGVEAQWDPGDDYVTLVEADRGVGLPASVALLRAMLEAIDAQQGGAS